MQRLSAAQKPGRGAPPYSRWVNRPLGRVIAATAYLVDLKPNHVTALSAACTFTGIALLALVPPVPWLGLVVGVLLVLGYALDSADGQVARLRGGGSLAGEWLDHMVDVTKTCLLHVAVLVSFARFGYPGGPGTLLLPLGYLTVSVVSFFGIMLADQLKRSRGGATTAGRSRGRLQTLVATPTDYGILCLVFLLAGWRDGFVVAYAVMLIGHSAALLAAIAKWWRDLTRMDHNGG
ncbi:MAG: CDP-alcohol phosphatidyltransferase family protein [Micrococcales bacterium]|nr:CDP-alcohol phosphatidyltransferase family protein [Micrococcales bacterium]